MKFRILVEYKDGSGTSWWEEYDKKEVVDCEEWSRKTIEQISKENI